MNDWRTTSVGVLGAAVQAADGAIRLGAGDNRAGWTSLALSVLWAVLGWMAKDKTPTV